MLEECELRQISLLIDCLTLPEPNNRHVLAAVVVGRADAIVTFNLKDFLEPTTTRHHLKALHFGDFLVGYYDLDRVCVLGAVKTCRRRMRNPPITPEEQIAALECQGLPQIRKLLRAAILLI